MACAETAMAGRRATDAIARTGYATEQRRIRVRAALQRGRQRLGAKAKRQRHEGWWAREGPCRHPPALNYRCGRLSSSACSPPRLGVRNPGGEEEEEEDFDCWCERLKLPA